MIDINKVKGIVKIIGDFTDEDLDKYSVIIENTVDSVSATLVDGVDTDDSRVVYLAATRVNLEIALCQHSGDGVTSFKAGDISITESNDALNYAKLLFNNAKSDCAGLLIDDSFAFLGV